MVDKITSPITSIELINKTNEIIDNLGSSSGISYTATCPAITPVDGVATWVVTHNLGTQAVVTALYSNNNKVEHNTLITSNNALTVTFKASSAVSAGDYKIVVLASGGTGGGGGADADLSNITDTAKVNIANISLPSGTYTNLTLGASGSTYTAPADGWFSLAKRSTGTQYIAIINNSNLLSTQFDAYGTGHDARLFIPVLKGDVIQINYTFAGDTHWFRFIYTKGSESEAS